MPADASGVIEIESSLGKMLGLSALAVLMTAMSAAVAFSLLPGTPLSGYQQAMGYGGTVFFGLCFIVIVWRHVTTRGPVVTITPDGIRDVRIAAELIPWRAVRAVTTWEYRRQKCVVLSIDPTVESKLTLTAVARWSRGPNRALGADGLCMTAQGLKTDFDTLLSACQNRVRTAQGGTRAGA